MTGFVAALVVATVGCQMSPPSSNRVRSYSYRSYDFPQGFGLEPLPAPEPTRETAERKRLLEREIVRWTNVERMARGLSPVRWSGTLARAAKRHSDEMRRLQYFSHTSPVSKNKTLLNRVRNAGLKAGAFLVGENLAWGNWSYEQARQIVQAWMASSGHRENLLRPSFRYLGVGVVQSGGDIVATQVFGTTG